MKKRNLLLLLAWMLAVNAIAQTQSKKWFLASQEIDLQTTTLTSTPLASGSDIGPSNGAYDLNGDLQFYINGKTLYDKNGVSKATLTYLDVDKENDVVIVPFLNNTKCQNKYYIFYVRPYFSSPSSGGVETDLYIGFVDVDPISGDITFANLSVNSPLPTAVPTSPLIVPGSYGGSLAISDVKGGKRFLYIANGNDYSSTVHKIEITAPDDASTSGYEKHGIGSPTLIYTTGAPSTDGGMPLECDLSPNGMRLAFSASAPISGLPYYYPRYTIIDLNSSGNFSSSKMFTLPVGMQFGEIAGVEFNNDGTKLFASSGGNSLSDPSRGIYIRDLATNTTSSVITGSEDYASSQIEKGYNGLMYVAKNATIQGIDPATGLLVPSSVSAFFTQLAGSSMGFLLPDQIDGSNYDNYMFNMIAYDAVPSSLTPGTWTQTSNPFNSSAGVIRLNEDINLTAGGVYNMSALNIEFGKNVKINIASGVTLNINGSTLKGIDCPVMWDGITIQPGATLKINDATTSPTYIFDAYTAIHAVTNDGYNLTVKYTEFDRNFKHIVLDYSPGSPSVTIENNFFKHTLALKDQSPDIGVLKDDGGTGLRYGKTSLGIANEKNSTTTTVSNNEFRGGQMGLALYKADVVVDDCQFLYMIDFKGVGVSSNQMKTNNKLVITDCDFTSVFSALTATQSTDINFSNNIVHNTSNNAVDLFNNHNSSISIVDNTFNFCTNNAIILTDNGGKSEAEVSGNEIHGLSLVQGKPTNKFVGISILETSGPSTSLSYNTDGALNISGNIMTNVAYGIMMNGIKGSQKNTPKSEGTSVIKDNDIQFATTVTPNRQSTDYNTGIELLYSNGMRTEDNTLLTSNNKSWRNRGIHSEWTTSSLYKSNQVTAGRGISGICDAIDNNYLCNTFTSNVNGISFGDHWMRTGLSDLHGITTTQSRENSFSGTLVKDIEVYVTPLGSTPADARIEGFLTCNQWLFSSTPNFYIEPTPPGSATTTSIDAGRATDICIDIPLSPPGDSATYGPTSIWPIEETTNNWQWAYEYEKERKAVGLVANSFISALIDVQDFIATGELDSAQLLLNGLSSGVNIEKHFITVFSMYVDNLLEDVPLDSVVLDSIASMDPKIEGPAVYIARGMMWRVFGKLYVSQDGEDHNQPAVIEVLFGNCYTELPASEITVTLMTEHYVSISGLDIGIDSINGTVYLPGYVLQALSLPSPYEKYKFIVEIDGKTVSTPLYSTDEWLSMDDVSVDICKASFKSTGIPTASISAKKSDVVVYPNPNNGIFTITNSSTDILEMQIIDINGKLILKQKVASDIIDLSGQTPGVYYVRFLKPDGSNVHSQSILIQH